MPVQQATREVRVFVYRVVGTNEIVKVTTPYSRIASPAALWDTGAGPEWCRVLVWNERNRGYTFEDGSIVPHGPPVRCDARIPRVLYDGERVEQRADAGNGPTKDARCRGAIDALPANLRANVRALLASNPAPTRLLEFADYLARLGYRDAAACVRPAAQPIFPTDPQTPPIRGGTAIVSNYPRTYDPRFRR